MNYRSGIIFREGDCINDTDNILWSMIHWYIDIEVYKVHNYIIRYFNDLVSILALYRRVGYIVLLLHIPSLVDLLWWVITQTNIAQRDQTVKKCELSAKLIICSYILRYLIFQQSLVDCLNKCMLINRIHKFIQVYYIYV